MNIMKGAKVISVGAAVTLIGLLAGGGCTLFESEQVAKGRKLFMQYCVHCHGPSGSGDGYNATRMDPRPRDLTDSQEEFLRTMSDEEVFSVFSRDMVSYEEFEEEFGEEEDFDFMFFVPPNMPTFKHTLAEEERWALVAFVRTLHGMKAEVDVAALRQEREEKVKVAQGKLEAAQKNWAAAEEAAEARDEEEPDLSKEEEAVDEADMELGEVQSALDNLTKRRVYQIARPELNSAPEELEPLIAQGEALYSDKYGCDSCHSIGGRGGVVGPPLDRAGFRLNGTWVYRWIRSPQAIKRRTKMPNLGVTDEHARAITAYLGTLRAAPPATASGAPAQQAAL